MSGQPNYSSSQDHNHSPWFDTPPTRPGTSLPNTTAPADWSAPWPDGSYSVSMSVNATPLNEKRGKSFSPTPHSNDIMPLIPPSHKKTSPGSSSSTSPYGSIDDIKTDRVPTPLMSPVNNRSSSSPLHDQAGILRCQSPSGGPAFVVRDGSNSPQLEASVRCDCHVKVEDNTTKKAKIKLIIALVIALAFMVGEVLGGYFSGSLAIMTDAAHMLSDFAGFLISLFAIWLGSQPASKRMSFGWHRAEVVGAVVSVLIIWVLTGVLFYEAVKRIIHQDFEVDADIMLITACVGVFVNVFMCMVLHQHSHGHSHGGGGGHRRHRHRETQVAIEEEASRDQGQSRRKRRKLAEEQQNINVRAAFIHVIGDLIQSIGVVIAGYVIWFKPEWKIVDPICTFLFCILVLISTLNVMKDALRVLMEGTPKHINYKDVKEDLSEISGVKQPHSLHIWSLTMNRTALSAHLALEPGANNQEVLENASRMLKENYNITQTTLQVEEYHTRMNDCNTCQDDKKVAGLLSFCNC